MRARRRLVAWLAYAYGMAGALGGMVAVVLFTVQTGIVLHPLATSLAFLVCSFVAAWGGRSLTHRILVGGAPPPVRRSAIAAGLVGITATFAVLELHGLTERTAALASLALTVHALVAIARWRRVGSWPSMLVDQGALGLCSVLAVGAGGSLLLLPPGAFLPVLVTTAIAVMSTVLAWGQLQQVLFYRALFDGRFEDTQVWARALGGLPALKALVHMDAGELDEAERILAAQNDDEAPITAYGRAIALDLRGRKGEALAAVDALWEDLPTPIVAQLRIRLSVEVGEADSLARWIDRARSPAHLQLALRVVGFDPTSGQHVTEAWLALHEGDEPALRCHLENAVGTARLPLSVAGVHAARAQLLHRLGDPGWQESAEVARRFGGAPGLRVASLDQTGIGRTSVPTRPVGTRPTASPSALDPAARTSRAGSGTASPPRSA